MFLIFRRSSSDWERGVDHLAEGNGFIDPRHAIMFVGIPSTEISAIILADSVSLEGTKKAVIENGSYVPIYDLSGRILFTEGEYDVVKADENIANAPVEPWDFSLKSGGQKGSNPGAEFLVPEAKEQVRYYVKFKREELDDQMWNELLADKIYSALGILVPKTKAVRVEGAYGRASKMIEGTIDGTGGSNDWKKGYLADCLLANWDILSALEQNTVSVPQTGEVFRVDNGGALLYRAKGERKAVDDFSETVNELNEASVVSPQKMGISDQEIKPQARSMKDKLNNDIIDQLVDSVRLRAEDREYLKNILKKRRDFITSKYGST